jgi:oligopeptide/dipeptide ABC transporter ATP-binding protein
VNALAPVDRPAGTDELIAVEGLRVSFPTPDGGRLVAVRDVSLSIAPGEFVGLMGEPGCGKSTIATALLGLVRPPGRIEAGTVRFAGRDLLLMSEAERASLRGHQIGLIVQNPRTSLHPLLNVGSQIANVYRAHNKGSRKAAWARAIEMLEMVGINDPARRARAYPHELSTGMTQRVLIAMALSSTPRLLIADEPTSGLDVTIQTGFLDQMWQAARATGSAVLLVTQNLGIVANYCDRVLIMRDGAIVERAPVRTFFETPQHEYSRRVLALQREEGGASRAARSDEIADAPPLIDVQALTKQFVLRNGGTVHAVDDVSFALRPGECLGLVGESGSGKTTTGRCLLRLETPTAGTFAFRGQALSGLSEAEFRPYRAQLQIVFQDPLDSMNPRWSVRDVIGELLALHGNLPPTRRNGRIDELLTLVGLTPDVAERRPSELSAGRQQRVAIARAIATNPDFIVLDEPTSALTPETTAEIITLLMDLSRRLGLAYLFISHDLTTVKYICHQIAVMYLGQIVEIGTKEQVFGAPEHPYTQALIGAHLFPDLSTRRVDRPSKPMLSGEIPSPINLPQGCYLASRCTYRTDRCLTERQALVRLADGRGVRCWRAARGEIENAPTHAAVLAV